NARTPSRKTRGVIAQLGAPAAGFDADHPYVFVLHEIVEEADRITSASNARDQNVGNPSLFSQNLRPSFAADHGLKVADHHRVGMRAEDRAEHVVGGPHIRYPVTHGLVDCILQRLTSP